MEVEQKGELLTPEQQAIIAEKESGKLATKVETIKIKNDNDLSEASAQLVEVKKMLKDIKAQKDPTIKDLNSAIKRVRDLFRPAEDRLTEAEQSIKHAILNYHNRKEALAAKKLAKVEQAVDAGELSLADGMDKISKVKQPESVIAGGTGSSQIRITKSVRITDAAALPASYFMRDRVIEALRIEVSEDVLRKKLPCPAGAEVVENKSVSGITG